VLAIYGGMAARELIALAHDERPWLDACGDLEPTARSQAVITPVAMAAYYSSRAAEADADADAIANPTFVGTAAELDALLPQ